MDIKSILTLFLEAFLSFPINIMFWLVVILVGSQYRRMAQNEVRLLGRPRHVVWQQVLSSALYGFVGGLVASMLLFIIGIPLTEIGIYFVWPLALLLLLVHPRYLCFAYAGGVVGAAAAVIQLLASIWPLFAEGIFVYLYDIHIPGLLALIGSLHLAESVLIALSGHLFPSPTYLKTEKGVVGAFMLQKFWPLPLVGIMAMAVEQAASEAMAGTEMPEWWPLFASRMVIPAGFILMYYILPIVAGLGYGDIAVSTTPRQKAKQSARNLALYSLLVLILSLFAEHVPRMTVFAALFVPLGHEYLIHRGNKKEFAADPIYTAPENGVKVLDVFTKSAAEQAGVLPGDIIMAINGTSVQNLLSFQMLLKSTWLPMQLLVERGAKQRLVIVDDFDLGIIPVPDRYAVRYMTFKHEHFWGALKQKIRRLKKNNNKRL